MLAYILIIFFAALVQGMTSFGFSLLAMPFLTFFMPLQLIVPILVVCSLCLNCIIFFQLKGQLYIKRMILMLIVGIVSTPIGVELLTLVDEKHLKFCVGSLIIISALIMFKGIHFRFSNKQITYIITGFMSGVLNGSVSLSGPPVVLMFVNEGQEKETFRKNISGYFLTLNIFTIPSFFAKGLLTHEVITYSGIGIVALSIGAIIGVNVSEGIDELKFKRLVLMMIMGMGLMTIISIF